MLRENLTGRICLWGDKMFRITKLTTLFLLLSLSILFYGCEGKSNKGPEQETTAQTEKIVPTEKVVQSSQKLVYNFEGMSAVKVNKNVVYKTYNNKDKLRLDVYYALGDKDTSKVPTVVLVHGIAQDTNLKDSDVYKTWGRKIGASGFNAITFNWRPAESSKDVSDLIKYIRDNAKELKINSENITIAAFSAGVDEGLKDAMEVNTGFIKNIVAYYGYIDDDILTINKNVKLPSFFIAMAAYDELFPPSTIDKFITKAKEAGCSVTKMVHSKAGHGFDAFKADDEETKDIIDKTLKFIDDNSK